MSLMGGGVPYIATDLSRNHLCAQALRAILQRANQYKLRRRIKLYARRPWP